MTVRGIVFLDIDGTLVPTGSSSSFLAERLGHQDELDRAEEGYANGRLSNQEVSAIDARGWKGTLVATLDRWLEDLPVIGGVDAVVSWCRGHQVEPVLASLAWQPVSKSIAHRYGITANGGPRVGVSDFVYDGTVAEHFDEYDKRDRALSLAGERGLTVDQCCAVGDSRSDLPLFAATPMSLALNAGDAARAGATDAIETHDLIEIVPWLEKWESRLG